MIKVPGKGEKREGISCVNNALQYKSIYRVHVRFACFLNVVASELYSSSCH